MDILQAENIKHLRGAILRMVYENHCKQHTHLRLVSLAGVLERLFYDIALNNLVTVLQDLRERGYLAFKEQRDRWSGRMDVSKISITPEGRDLVEGTRQDAAVEME